MSAVTAVRTALVALGAAGVVGGGLLLLGTQRPDQWVSALVWLAAVVVVHDGVLMPLLALRRLVRAHRRAARAGGRTTGHGRPSPPAS